MKKFLYSNPKFSRRISCCNILLLCGVKLEYAIKMSVRILSKGAASHIVTCAEFYGALSSNCRLSAADWRFVKKRANKRPRRGGGDVVLDS